MSTLTRARARAHLTLPTLALALALALPAATAVSAPSRADHHHAGGVAAPTLRVATFNASLNRASEGELVTDLASGTDTQAAAVAEVVQRVRPDLLLLNEFDYDAAGEAVDLFRTRYLGVGQNGAAPIHYRYAFSAPSNTGIPTGLDLDGDGSVGGGNDAFGFGAFPGQYGMVVLSRFPIEREAVRTFQRFRWSDMPGNRLPTGYYSPRAQQVLRLSSKSHWDVPVRVGRRTVHVLASHPTPPTFDGPEDRNGLRNADEIRFWADYVRGARYPVDDAGQRGGLRPGSTFVILGDLNADPVDGDSVDHAVTQVLDLPRVVDPAPRSAGGTEAAQQGGANTTQAGDPALDTADFSDSPAPGNLRVDYVLPSRGGWKVERAGVFWPAASDPLSRLTGTFPFPTSDHRLVWVDLLLPGR